MASLTFLGVSFTAGAKTDICSLESSRYKKGFERRKESPHLAHLLVIRICQFRQVLLVIHMYGFKLDLVSPVFDQFDGNIFIIAYSHKLLGLCVPI